MPGSDGVVWEPPEDVVAHANVRRFMDDNGIQTLDELLARSRRDVAWFWGAVERHLAVRWHGPYDRVLDESDGVPWARWFTAGLTNVTLNCVDHHADARPEHPAVRWEGEDGERREWTYRELQAEVNRLAHLLRELGIGNGDAVGIYMPALPETVAAVFATAKLGGIVVPLYSDFGAGACGARLADVEAKAVITADGHLRRGERVLMKDVVDAAADAAPTVEQVVVLPRFGDEVEIPWNGTRDVDWREETEDRPEDLETLPVGSEHAFMILYTPGTTGTPKGTVHTHAGFLVKAAQEAAHHVDVHAEDVVHWATDMGNIMGPWTMVSTLFAGGTVLLYEGAPDHPEPDRLWRVLAENGATIVGFSPTLVRRLRRHGGAGPAAHDLSRIRVIASTGAPWNREAWTWTFENVGNGRAPIINLSGGTEVGTFLLGPTPLTPLTPGSLGHPALGVAADVFDADGNPAPPGVVGDLVVTRPWPGMTRGLWLDPDRYLDAYWSRWPDTWVHGDLASRSEDGQWFLHGRTDDSMKVAGTRIAPVEVEGALLDTGHVVEAAAVGLPDPVQGERVHAWAIPAEDREAGSTLEASLKRSVAEVLGKPFSPATIHFVTDLPRTRNGKLVRRVLRAQALGEDPGDLSGLVNPWALDEVSPVTAPAGSVNEREA